MTKNRYKTRYFKDDRADSLFRRRPGHLDDVFVGGVWQETDATLDWMVGENDFLNEITEAEARELAPAAFT